MKRKSGVAPFRFALIACLCMNLSGCLVPMPVPLPIIGGGIAGAGRDSDAVRKEAWNYPEFKEKHVQTEITQQAVNKTRTDRNNYFADFADHVHVRRNTPTRMGSF